jgi:SAC3 family protein LENG8/THP3
LTRKMQQAQFVNPDGTPWTPHQIQEYYNRWNKYYQDNPHLNPENIAKQQSAYSYSQAVAKPKIAQPHQHNPFANSPFVNTQKMSALEAARSSGKAAKVSTTAVVQQPPKWPPSLKAYVQNVFQSSKSGKKTIIEGKLKKLIALATDSNSLWTVPWERVALPDPDTPLDDLPSLVPTQNHQATPIFQNLIKKKKRSTPIIPDEPLPKFAKLMSREIPKSVKKLQPEILTVAQSDLGFDKKEERKRRFEQEQKEALKKMTKRQVIGPSPVQARPLLSMDTNNPDNFDWNDFAIVGTCAELEKPYLRLTSAPDPSTVRPLQILKKTLEMLKSRWRKEHNYTFICDQFKSLRQDLTVQRIKNEFTVKVYETHSRIAIEKVF